MWIMRIALFLYMHIENCHTFAIYSTADPFIMLKKSSLFLQSRFLATKDE